MKARIRNTGNAEGAVRTGRIGDACKRYSLGRDTMRKVADAAGAVIKIGNNIYLIDYKKVDEYLEKLCK